MLLANRCEHEFDEKTKSRGRSYFHQGRVKISELRGTSTSARVTGTYGAPFTVDLDWSEALREGVISARCTCPRFDDGFLCKHLWATLLELDKQGHAHLVPGGRRIEIVDFENDGSDGDDEWDDDEFDSDDEWHDAYADDEEFGARGRWGRGNFRGGLGQDASGTFSASIAELRRHAGPSHGAARSWRRVLGSVERKPANPSDVRFVVKTALDRKERLAWYVVHVGQSYAHGELILDLAQQERRKDGTYGKQKAVSVDDQSLLQFRDPVDQRILSWALANELEAIEIPRFGFFAAPTSLRTIRVPPADYEWCLSELASTGRLLWDLAGAENVQTATTLTWDAGDAWSFRPRVVAGEGRGGGWLLEGKLVRSDEERSLADVVMALEQGLVLFPDRLVRVEVGEVFPLLRQLHAAGPLSIPAKDRDDFLQVIYRLPCCKAVQLPDALRLPEQADPPKPLLRVKAPVQGRHAQWELTGEIFFRYGDELVGIGDPRERIMDAEHERLFVRNRPAEGQRLLELRESPVRLPHGYDSNPGELRVDRPQLHDLVDQLIARGWEVEAEGALVRRPGDFNIQVTSSVDWFELDASVDYGGEVVKLPALLAALRRGEKYVRLGDGSQGMLPEAWLSRFDKLMHLADEDKDTVRFTPSQALLLDALLAEQENVRTDLSFRKFRDRLRSFAGVKAAEPPRGFQGELRDYQKAGLGWFGFLSEMNFGGCLADDMGLGKTVQVLGLLEHRRTRRLKKDEQRRPSLCVVPKSLVFNWVDEATRFAPRLRVVNYTGLDRKSREYELTEADLVVTTYGTLRRDVVELKDRRFDYVILDEAQAIKNHNSQAAKACRLLQAEHRLALTGTPIENHLGELWSLFEFINPGMLGNCTAFASLCRGTRNGSNGNGESEMLTGLSKAIAPFVLRRTKEQVLSELPEKSEQTIHCELSKKERKEYDELRDFYRAQLGRQIEEVGLEKSKIHVLEALLRLRQAACHPGLIDKKKSGQPSAKLEALLEQLHEVIEGGHKALVFSQFTSLLSIVRQRLDTEGIKYEYLDGRTRKRKEHVERFQNDAACPLFLISLKAGGHGLNLTAADYVFILDPWWNPAVEAQAIDRTHRIGQTRRVFAYRLIAKDTVEEKVLELQKQKKELADAIITANESLIRKLTADDLQQILS